MEAALKSQTEWSRAAVFSASGSIMATNGQISASDIPAMTTAFNDKDTTFGNGINIGGKNFEVHRYYDDIGLIYGRTHSVNPQDGEGFCLARVKQGTTGQMVFIIITYVFPILSAKAVPDLQGWAKEWIENQ